MCAGSCIVRIITIAILFYFPQLAYKIGTTARSKLAQVDQWLEGKHILTEVTLPKDARDPGLNDEQTKVKFITAIEYYEYIIHRV